MSIFAKIWKYCIAFLTGLLFAVVCFIGINTIAKPFSTPQYCGGKCHEMNTAYKTWELSTHGANDSGVIAECVDCHLPPKDKFFTHMLSKVHAGAKDTYMHHFGDEYDLEETRKKVLETMPNNRCLNCHSGLLVKPSSPAARMAHQQTLNPADDVKPRCVECHAELHERKKKVFSPD